MEFPIVGHMYRTDRLRADGDGTLNDVYLSWENTGRLAALKDGAVAVMVHKFFGDATKRIREMIAEGMGTAGSATT